MAEQELIWVEIELQVADAYHNYNCQISAQDYKRIECGFFENPFIKVQQVHWYKLPEENTDDWQGKKLIEYGTGDYSEYSGEALLRIDRITSVFRLEHGPQEPEKEL